MADQNTSWVSARQTKFATYTTVYVLIVLGVLGVLNFLANRYDKSYDTTANKQFTLSDQTLKIAHDLKQDVKITYWDQPTRFQAARDLLERYKGLSSKIDVSYQDADKNRTKALAAGVKTLGTIQVDSGDKHETAKSLSEEEVTGAIVRTLKSGERMACFVLGSGEHSLDDNDRIGYSQAKQLLESNNYKSQTIKLIEKPEVPMDCMIAIAAGPTRDYLQPEVDALEKFVEGGGKAMFFLDPPLKFAKQNVDDNTALTGLLASWGVTADKDLVLDTSGIGQIFGMGPEVPLATHYGTHAVVRTMKDVATGFPLARSLQAKDAGKTKVESLVETSDNSFATTNLASAEINVKPTDKKGPFTLAVAGTYDGKGRFVVTGSSSFIANFFLRFNGNRDLFLNMMNWLSSDEDLISIRPKEPEDRRITLTRSQMAMVFYSSVLALPLLIVLAGVGVWWKRR